MRTTDGARDGAFARSHAVPPSVGCVQPTRRTVHVHVLAAHAVPPARTIARIAHWLLPWACTLILSASLAHALEQALSQTLPQPPVLPTRAASATAAPTAARPEASCDGHSGSMQYVGPSAWIRADPQGPLCQASPAQPGARTDLEHTP
jgi:hypothetical protein